VQTKTDLELNLGKNQLGDKAIRPIASFVLTIHFKNHFVCKIDDRKHIQGRLRSNFQKTADVLAPHASGPSDMPRSGASRAGVFRRYTTGEIQQKPLLGLMQIVDFGGGDWWCTTPY
jgi:hypothetical protein